MRIRLTDPRHLEELVAALLDAECVLGEATADEIEVVSVWRRAGGPGTAAASELDAIELRFFLRAWQEARRGVEVFLTP